MPPGLLAVAFTALSALNTRLSVFLVSTASIVPDVVIAEVMSPTQNFFAPLSVTRIAAGRSIVPLIPACAPYKV